MIRRFDPDIDDPAERWDDEDPGAAADRAYDLTPYKNGEPE